MMYRDLKSNSGQTLVEYVLVLTIALIVVLGTVYQLNQNFRNYAQNYFGNYVRCLLENGELPNLGSQTNPNSFCDSEYQPFSLAFGRPPLDDASSSSENDANNENKSASKEGKEDGEVGGSGSGEENNTSGRAASFSQPARLGANSNLRQSRITIDPNKDKDKAENNQEGAGVSSRQVRRRGFNSSSRQKTINRQIGRPTYFAASKMDEENIAGANIQGKVQGQAEGDRLRNRKIEQTIPKRKPSSDIQEEELGIGNFIRYLIIAAIVIAIILFLFGQVLQIQKSIEKG